MKSIWLEYWQFDYWKEWWKKNRKKKKHLDQKHTDIFKMKLLSCLLFWSVNRDIQNSPLWNEVVQFSFPLPQEIYEGQENKKQKY